MIILFLLIISLIANFSSKSEEKLVKRLTIIVIISSITMLIFFGIKINLDGTYTNKKFEQIYIEQSQGKISEEKTKVSIGLIDGLGFKTEKEYYVDECVKMYNIFKIKINAILGANLLLNILIIYQIYRLMKIQRKKNKLDKDDIILYDDEENVKI